MPEDECPCELQETKNGKLPSHIYRKVEGVLYSYKYLSSNIKIKENELEEMIPSLSTSVVTIVGKTKDKRDSQQERWLQLEDKRAMRLYREIQRMKVQKYAVDEALRWLDERDRKIFELKYMQEQQHGDVADILGVTRPGYYLVKNRFATKMARYLGLV